MRLHYLRLRLEAEIYETGLHEAGLVCMQKKVSVNMPPNSNIPVILPEDALDSFLALEKCNDLSIPSWIFETARTGMLAENGCRVLHAPSWAIRYGVAFLSGRERDLIIIRADSTESDEGDGRTAKQTVRPLAGAGLEGAQDQLVLSLSHGLGHRRWFVSYYIEDCFGAGFGARLEDRIKNSHEECCTYHSLKNASCWIEMISGNPLVCTPPKAHAGQRLYIVVVPYPS